MNTFLAQETAYGCTRSPEDIALPLRQNHAAAYCAGSAGAGSPA